MHMRLASASCALLLVAAHCSTKAPADDAGSGGRGSGGSSAAGTGGTGSGTGGLLNPAPASRSFAGTNFWNVEWERSNILLPDVDFATTTNPWVPELLTGLEPYSVLRLMDWNGTNADETPQAHFDTRKKKTEPQGELIAYEWQIDLCNRTHKDYWLNLHHRSTVDDWKQVARLVKTSLDPNLRVYLEWSNEVWNESFPQNAYATSQAQSLGLSGTIPASSYYVYQAVRLFEAFDEVFASEPDRLVHVLAGFAGWNGPCEAHVLALQDATINPRSTRPDVYAVAPYVHGATMAELNAGIAQVATDLATNVSCANKLSLPVIGYEGGPDSYSVGVDGCVTLQHDPGMHDFYLAYLDALTKAGLRGPYMQYTHSGACWGLKEKVTDAASTSPKYVGLLDWLKSL
ncbi:MAG TPA: hypothetical protein VLC09_12960 [Polyangiaceae bacterium]|nr:hypothetical protein [Polyangiaceae bacterium]